MFPNRSCAFEKTCFRPDCNSKRFLSSSFVLFRSQTQSFGRSIPSRIGSITQPNLPTRILCIFFIRFIFIIFIIVIIFFFFNLISLFCVFLLVSHFTCFVHRWHSSYSGPFLLFKSISFSFFHRLFSFLHRSD